MDGDERRKRQHDATAYHASGMYRPSVTTASDRFRQPSTVSPREPTSAPSSQSRSGGVSGFETFPYAEQSSYGPSSMQTSALQGAGNLPYQSDFGQASRGQQSPQHGQQNQAQFGSYGQGMMYGIGQQTPGQSSYESVPQYQSRQPTTVDTLSTQFGVPQYFSPNESTSAGMHTSATQYITSQVSPTGFPQQSPIGRSAIGQQFQPNLAGFSSMGSENVATDVGQDPSGYDDAYNAAYNQYQQALKQTFQNTRDGRLVEASRSLLEITEWLLGHAQDLGLDRDEEELHGDRVKLWDEFNTCWLAVLQKQKDVTNEMLETGQPASNVLSAGALENMGRELVRLCDRMERHGLVDYQMGVWEEEIFSFNASTYLRATMMPPQKAKAAKSVAKGLYRKSYKSHRNPS